MPVNLRRPAWLVAAFVVGAAATAIVMRFLAAAAERRHLDSEDENIKVYFELPNGSFSWREIISAVERGTDVGQRYVQTLIDAAEEEEQSLEEYLGLETHE